MPRPFFPLWLGINAYTVCRFFVNICVGVFFFTNSCQGGVSFVKISWVTVFSVGSKWISFCTVLHEIRKRKANWFGHILRRNCLLKQVIEGKIKGEMGVTRRRRKLLDDLKDRRGYSHLKEEALDRTMWRNRFGGGLDLSSDRILNEWTVHVFWRFGNSV